MTQSDNIPTHDLHNRRCRKCGDQNMALVARNVDVWGVEHRFVCPACGHEAMLASAGGSGLYLAAALVAIGAIALVMGLGDGFSTVETLLLAFLFALFFSPPLLDAIKRRRYPLTEPTKRSTTVEPAPDARPQNSVQKSMLWLDRLGFVWGFLGLFVFIAFWFAVWTIVGLIGDVIF